LFGKKEVLNRLHFVSKHPELSRPLCCLALFVRCLMSVVLGITRWQARQFKRTVGNLVGFALASRNGFGIRVSR
jgi:membrane protein DedA with SNARE-associated domain